MNPIKSESDEDKYMPSGLLNCVNQTIESKDINTNEIAEFYNAEKIRDDASGKQSSSSVIIDLSAKHPVLGNNSIPPSQSQISPEPTAPQGRNSPFVRGRILSIPPGPPSVVHPSSRLPLPGSTLHHHRLVHPQQVHPTMYRPVPVPLHSVIQMPVRPMMYSSRPHPYAHAGYVPMKMLHHPQVYTHYVSSARNNPYLPIHPVRMYPSYGAHSQAVHPSNVHNHISQPTVVHSTIASSTIAQSSIAARSIAHSSVVFPPNIMASSFNASTVPVFSSGIISVSNALTPMQSLSGNPSFQEVTSMLKFGAPSDSAAFDANELRKKLKIEALAKAKEEKECRRAELKAKRETERERRKKELKKENDLHNKKMSHFAKDMFVIRLKDVDSFDRNNEIWRIDNHILIQKFCGVPSLRAPARQFQSTNKMAGYDTRAIWRFFIIDSEHVEVDKYGSEITIHKFPSISVLRDAKKVAEVKDEEFKSTERGELKEKQSIFEATRISKTAEKQKKRIERKQKKFGAREQWSASKVSSSDSRNEENDEDVCRSIINGLLDALEDENYNEEDSFYTSEEEDELSFSDEDDAGSLITLAHSTDTEEEITSLDEKDAAFELYSEHEVPEVAFELTLD